jgi:uncharacterized membrane protein
MPQFMDKNRLEAFSDGVIAIILTIMVLDLKVPHEHTVEALGNAWPIFGAYALSYWNVFLIWLNHHNLFASVKGVDRTLLIANGQLLFVVSFVPFVTAFASESHWAEAIPASLYGVLLAAVAAAFARLRYAAGNRPSTELQREMHIAEARVNLVLAGAFLVCAGVAWFVPRWAMLFYALVPLGRVRYRRAAAVEEENH